MEGSKSFTLKQKSSLVKWPGTHEFGTRLIIYQ